MVREPSNRANLELVTIYEISKILSSSLDLSKTFREVLNLLAAHLEIRRGLIILKHEDGALHLFSAVGLSRDEYERGKYQSGEGIVGRILSSGMPVVVPDISQEPLFLNRTGALDEQSDAAIAMIGVPIKAGGDKVGVLTIDRAVRKHGRGFDDDVRFLSMVSNLLGQALSLQRNVSEERAQLMQEVRRTTTSRAAASAWTMWSASRRACRRYSPKCCRRHRRGRPFCCGANRGPARKSSPARFISILRARTRRSSS